MFIEPTQLSNFTFENLFKGKKNTQIQESKFVKMFVALLYIEKQKHL